MTYSNPTFFRRLHARIPVHASHIPERFALFTIIVLGESVVAVALGTPDQEWELSSAVAAGLGFAAAAAIWWTYFGHGVEFALERSTNAILVFAHVHIPLLAALTAVSAGIALSIEQAGESSLDSGSRWALAGGAAVYLACVTVAQRTMVLGFLPRTAQARAVAVVALVALALLGGEIDPLVFSALTSAVLVMLVALKLRGAQRVARTRRTAELAGSDA